MKNQFNYMQQVEIPSSQHESQTATEQFQHHRVIIVGAGISGMQAGLICAEKNDDFIILEAAKVIGGRINTMTLGKLAEEGYFDASDKPWFTEKVKAVLLQFGATWISADQPYMNKLISDHNLQFCTQYDNGKYIYGESDGQFKDIDMLSQYFGQFKSQLDNLFDRVQKLHAEMNRLEAQGGFSSQNREEHALFVHRYDNMSVTQFLHEVINEDKLEKILVKEIQTLACISCEELSVLQFLYDNSGLENVQFYTGRLKSNIDGYRVKEGMLSVINSLKEDMSKQLKAHGKEVSADQLIKLDSAVVEIKNAVDRREDRKIVVAVKDGRKYTCEHVILATPISVTRNISIEEVPLAKKLIYENQIEGSVTRYNMIFPTAFWRSKYTGYATFSHHFPFNQLVDLSPSNLSCGILAFVFVSNGFEKWDKQFKQKYGNDAQHQKRKYALSVVAKMYLKGNTEHEELQQAIAFHRNVGTPGFIGGTYQSMTKATVWSKIQQRQQSFLKVFSEDLPHITVLGSEFAPDFAGYMEGAIELARMKLHNFYKQIDPWEKLKHSSK